MKATIEQLQAFVNQSKNHNEQMMLNALMLRPVILNGLVDLYKQYPNEMKQIKELEKASAVVELLDMEFNYILTDMCKSTCIDLTIIYFIISNLKVKLVMLGIDLEKILEITKWILFNFD